MAHRIIMLINNVANVINNDPDTVGLLRMAFLPNYCVTAMEIICPSADLSEQISTAGKEISCMSSIKLMMNGSVTIGTLVGANIEILREVGHENFFMFGLTAEEVKKTRSDYDPNDIIAASEDLDRVLEIMESGYFNEFQPQIFDVIIASIHDPQDPWMTVTDFQKLCRCSRTSGEGVSRSRSMDPDEHSQLCCKRCVFYRLNSKGIQL